MRNNYNYAFKNHEPIACYYTDGSVRGNGTDDAIGAYGFVRIENEKVVDTFESKVEKGKKITNARMEMKGLIGACRDAARRYADVEGKIVICTDYSTFTNAVYKKWYQRWLSNNWVTSSGAKVAHIPLWKILMPFINDRRFIFVKVDGHKDDEYNNYIDRVVQNITFKEKFCANVVTE